MRRNDGPTFGEEPHSERTTMLAPTPLRSCVHTAGETDTLNVNVAPSVANNKRNRANNNMADVQERTFNN
jgi:hypothetical protein